MDMLTPQVVLTELQRKGLNITMRFFETTTATSQQAADNIGCELGQIVKSLCFIIETERARQPILVLTSGDQRVDDRKIADLFNVGRKKVKIATSEECIEIYGYAPGSVPPIAHRSTNLRTYIDESLQRFDQLYAAGGAHNAIFPITLSELIQVTSGIMMDVTRKNEGNS
jgi:prolyl-tRNA editing enzyme YbaK/EbsC (Cys-tRNA(Pro) deacylase)